MREGDVTPPPLRPHALLFEGYIFFEQIVHARSHVKVIRKFGGFNPGSYIHGVELIQTQKTQLKCCR